MLEKLTHLRAVYRVLAFIVGTLALVLVQIIWAIGCGIFRSTMPRRQSPIVRLWYKYCVWLLGLKVTIVNKRSFSRKQKIILSNHTSYLDILILGAYFDCFFVAKLDIAGWPIFGFLAKTGGTLFIERNRKYVKNQITLLETHLNARQSLLIFPEGTTNNGLSVQPFKSSLLNAAFSVKKPPLIQPISLIYTHMNGKKLETQDDYDAVAWYGDMLLAPHAWHVFRQKNIQAKIHVHPVIHITPDSTAKSITQQAEHVITDGFYHAHPAIDSDTVNK